MALKPGGAGFKALGRQSRLRLWTFDKQELCHTVVLFDQIK
jgi:hypothetical protein